MGLETNYNCVPLLLITLPLCNLRHSQSTASLPEKHCLYDLKIPFLSLTAMPCLGSIITYPTQAKTYASPAQREQLRTAANLGNAGIIKTGPCESCGLSRLTPAKKNRAKLWSIPLIRIELNQLRLGLDGPH